VSRRRYRRPDPGPPSSTYDEPRTTQFPPLGGGDPTQNVLDLVDSAIQRQDDLRMAESRHVREIAELRAQHAESLRNAESGRLDAIRTVDVGAVTRAAEVSAQQATILAAQVAASAEALRTQVTAAASAASAALHAALDPIQKDIQDLRRAQYEAQGVKANVGETRLNIGGILGGVSVALVIVFGLIAVLR
jgi:hypothetical protein